LKLAGITAQGDCEMTTWPSRPTDSRHSINSANCELLPYIVKM